MEGDGDLGISFCGKQKKEIKGHSRTPTGCLKANKEVMMVEEAVEEGGQERCFTSLEVIWKPGQRGSNSEGLELFFELAVKVGRFKGCLNVKGSFNT